MLCVAVIFSVMGHLHYILRFFRLILDFPDLSSIIHHPPTFSSLTKSSVLPNRLHCPGRYMNEVTRRRAGRMNANRVMITTPNLPSHDPLYIQHTVCIQPTSGWAIPWEAYLKSDCSRPLVLYLGGYGVCGVCMII